MQHTIDITKEHCPMTFVKTKIKLSQIAVGDTLEVILKAGEPLENVPRSAIEQGFTVLESTHIENDIHRLIIQK